MKKDIFAVTIVTLYLLIYVILLQFTSMEKFGVIMMLFSPLLLIWMVYTVLKFGKYHGDDLGDNEFGYHDRKKD